MNSRLSKAAALGFVQTVLFNGTSHAQSAPPDPPRTPTTPPTSARLPTVDITGNSYDADALSLDKYGTPLLTTPRSASVVTQQLMKDQAVTSLRDALRNVSGISIGAGEGSYQGDNLSIRGFAARSDIYLDGMTDLSNYNRDPFNLERAEVLKGASSAEFGRGAAGGVVNQESKKARLQAFNAGSVIFGTADTRVATVDVNAPIAGIDHAAFRINAMAHESNVADRDEARYKRWGVAPTVAFGIDTDTRTTFSLFHQSEHNRPDFGIPWLFDRPAPVARNVYYGFSDDYMNTDVNIGTVRVERDFGENLTLREQFRVTNGNRNFRISQANTDDIEPGTPLAQATVGRDIIDGVSDDRTLDQDISVLSRFTTGALSHRLVTGLEYVQYSVDPRRIEPTWANVPDTSLLNPGPALPFPGVGTPGTYVSAKVRTSSAYATDTMKLGEQWTLIGGLRYDRVSSNYNETVEPTAFFTAKNSAVTWRAAATYQPQANVSYYVSGGTSFHPNIQQLSVSSEPTLPPETAQVAVGRTLEFEVGTKWRVLDGKLALAAALFWDRQTNPAPVDLDDPLIDVVHGKERVRGMELSSTGRLTNDWRVLVSYTLQDSAVTASSDPTLIGHPVLNAPRQTVALWTTYNVQPSWQVGVGGNGVSSRNASLSPDPLNGLLMQAPGYFIMSAMAKYRVSKDVEVQANVTNLTDRYYYDGVHPGHVVPGAGRTFFMSSNFKF